MRVLALLLLLVSSVAQAGEPVFAPSFYVGLTNHGADQYSLPVRLGVTALWRQGHIAPFVSALHTFDLAGGQDETVHVPGFRVGVAVLMGDETNFLNCAFPALQVYGLVGARLAEHQPDALRLGVGLSSPVLFGVSVLAEVPLPSTIEVYLDVEEDGPRATMLSVGVGF
jgi:hypothetical protein